MDTANQKATVVKLRLPNPCGAHVLARALKRHGVEVLFGQSLPSALLLVIAEFGMRQIAYRTENAGGAMADGYARHTGKVGVATVTCGPGFTQIMTALTTAARGSIPLVVFAGDSPTSAAWYVQHLGFKVARAREDAPYTHFLADETGRIIVEL